MSELPSQYSTPQAVSGTYCVPWNPNDPLIPLYQQAALQFNTDQDPTLAAIIQVALQNQMMLYRKSSCTDCATAGLPPTQTVINPPDTIEEAAPTGIVQSGLSSAEQVQLGVSLGTEGADIGAQLATNALNIIPVIGAVSSVVQDIIGIFGASHTAAVAEEQSVNCSVAYAFNKWIPQYDSAVATGKMSADAALSAVTQIIQTQLSPALDPVISANNWGWGANQALQAHLYFRQQWYPQLESSLSPITSTLTAAGLGSASSALSSLTSNPYLLAIIVISGILLFSGGSKSKAVKTTTEAA